MKILVPTDFSANAAHALNYASLLGKALNADLIILHVYTPPVTRRNVAYPLITEEIAIRKLEAKENLHNISAGISEEYGIRCEPLVSVGTPIDEIIKEAENSHPDLIVMGTQGASGITKVLFGSNTTSVMESAPCPVLVVPANSAVALPKRIVFATNYEDNDIQTVKDLNKITQRLKAEFLLVHVSKENLKSERDLIEDFSKVVAKEINIEQPFYYVMHHENTKKGIDQFVDSIDADLIALSMRKRSIFKKLFDTSISKRMAYQARMPLLVFHAASSESEHSKL